MKKTRSSSLREQLLQVFQEQKKPLSVPEIQSLLEKKELTPHKTSLYRQLETMSEQSVLQSIVLDSGVAYFELQKHHHHHFVCNSCKKIECFENEMLENAIHLLEASFQKLGASIFEHQFSFRGKCAKCCQ